MKRRASGADKNISNLDVGSELKTDQEDAKAKSTTISRDTVNYIADTLSPVVLHADSVVHQPPKLDKILGDRTGSVLNDGAIDWGSTEQQAGSASNFNGRRIRRYRRTCGTHANETF